MKTRNLLTVALLTSISWMPTQQPRQPVVVDIGRVSFTVERSKPTTPRPKRFKTTLNDIIRDNLDIDSKEERNITYANRMVYDDFHLEFYHNPKRNPKKVDLHVLDVHNEKNMRYVFKNGSPYSSFQKVAVCMRHGEPESEKGPIYLTHMCPTDTRLNLLNCVNQHQIAYICVDYSFKEMKLARKELFKHVVGILDSPKKVNEEKKEES